MHINGRGSRMPERSKSSQIFTYTEEAFIVSKD